jgi:hypothetical protein
VIEALAFGCTLDGYGRFTVHSPMLSVCTRLTVIGALPVFVNVSAFETKEPAGTLPKSKELAVERKPARGAETDPIPEYEYDSLLLPDPSLLEIVIEPE